MSKFDETMDEFDEEMDEFDENATNMITLRDETGAATDFEFLDVIEYQDHEYAILLPVDADDDGEVVILEVLESEDEDAETEDYVGVTDDAILEAVFNIFKDKFKDEFNFTD